MVKRALNETKGGKAPGMDGVRVEMLKEGGVTVLEWLVRLFNICFMLSIVPVDWVIACMVPLYKGLSIYIPWPFPPVWGVADNTKEATKTMGVSLRSSSNDEGSSRVWMALLEQHSP